jgi:hypothetical protein
VQQFIPDKSGVGIARGIVAAGLISTVMWAGFVIVPLIVF